MWNKPTQKQLSALPLLYSTESIKAEDKIILMHFFLFGSDWWAVEYFPDNQVFFGFVILNSDIQNAEWGYFSLLELCEVKVESPFGSVQVDRDIHWKPQPARNVLQISRAQGWLEKASTPKVTKLR